MADEKVFDWRELANCSGLADLGKDNPFFVEGYGATYPTARRLCSTCPVVIDCLVDCVTEEFGMGEEGMWGCMSPNERRTLIRQMNKGIPIKTASEVIWNKHRFRRNGSPVPDPKVWEEWDA